MEKHMVHRHISGDKVLSSVAVDDIIDRGRRADWAFLRDAMRGDAELVDRVRRICAAHMHDAFDQKYHLWNLYADRLAI